MPAPWFDHRVETSLYYVVYRMGSDAKIQIPWRGDKVDSGIRVAHGKCVGLDSGVDIRWGYSELRHRVPYTMVFFGFLLWLMQVIFPLERSKVTRELARTACCYESWKWFIILSFLKGNVQLLLCHPFLYSFICTNNCVHTMFRIWCITIFLLSLLFSATHMMKNWDNAVKNYNSSPYRSFL